jgi:hypothetical protein
VTDPLKTGLLGSFGLMMFSTGGCLMWTPPLTPLALPLLFIGVVMWIASLRKRQPESEHVA